MLFRLKQTTMLKIQGPMNLTLGFLKAMLQVTIRNDDSLQRITVFQYRNLLIATLFPVVTTLFQH